MSAVRNRSRKAKSLFSLRAHGNPAPKMADFLVFLGIASHRPLVQRHPALTGQALDFIDMGTETRPENGQKCGPFWRSRPAVQSKNLWKSGPVDNFRLGGGPTRKTGRPDPKSGKRAPKSTESRPENHVPSACSATGFFVKTLSYRLEKTLRDAFRLLKDPPGGGLRYGAHPRRLEGQGPALAQKSKVIRESRPEKPQTPALFDLLRQEERSLLAMKWKTASAAHSHGFSSAR